MGGFEDDLTESTRKADYSNNSFPVWPVAVTENLVCLISENLTFHMRKSCRRLPQLTLHYADEIWTPKSMVALRSIDAVH